MHIRTGRERSQKVAAALHPGVFAVPDVLNLVGDAFPGVFRAAQKRQDNRQNDD